MYQPGDLVRVVRADGSSEVLVVRAATAPTLTLDRGQVVTYPPFPRADAPELRNRAERRARLRRRRA